jgi:hypothetical protein
MIILRGKGTDEVYFLSFRMGKVPNDEMGELNWRLYDGTGTDDEVS